MGSFILLTAILIEITFGIFAISTKSNQQRIRSIIRILAFTVFVVLTLLSIINWSFRYYALGTGLFFLAITGVITLFRHKEEKKPYRSAGVVTKAIGMTFLFFILTLPSIIYPEYKAMKPTGEYQVSSVVYSITDMNRIETYNDTGENRKINIQMWFPKNVSNKFPLIVFSPGAFSDKSSNITLHTELASHGYIVCAIDHTYQCQITRDNDGTTKLINVGYIKQIFSEKSCVDRQRCYELYQEWMGIRMGDMDFAIKYILEEVNKNQKDEVYTLVDTTKIGAMGYSLGGSTALGMGRERADISAVIALESSFIYDIKGVRDGEFVFTDQAYPVPVLNIYSDEGWNLLPSEPQYAENYALLTAPSDTTFNVHISGVGHFNFTDLALKSPILIRILNGKKASKNSAYVIETINKICLDFFDSFLKEEHKFTPREVY